MKRSSFCTARFLILAAGSAYAEAEPVPELKAEGITILSESWSYRYYETVVNFINVDLYRYLAFHCAGKGLTWRVSRDESVPVMIEADSFRLRQVLLHRELHSIRGGGLNLFARELGGAAAPAERAARERRG